MKNIMESPFTAWPLSPQGFFLDQCWRLEPPPWSTRRAKSPAARSAAPAPVPMHTILPLAMRPAPHRPSEASGMLGFPASFFCRAFQPPFRRQQDGRPLSLPIPSNLRLIRRRIISPQANHYRDSAIMRRSRRRSWRAAANSGESVAYSGGIESDGGETFTVTIQPVPEPSGQMLFLSSAAILWLIRSSKLRLPDFKLVGRQ